MNTMTIGIKTEINVAIGPISAVGACHQNRLGGYV
jgi:hypothetical protein